jgi:hypothetical protein
MTTVFKKEAPKEALAKPTLPAFAGLAREKQVHVHPGTKTT